MKCLLFILTLLLFSCDFNGKNGIEIYQLNWRSIDFLENNRKGNYCDLKINQEDLFDKPILTDSDIAHFDWNSQELILTEKGRVKIDLLKIPLDGLAVAMILNGEIIYGFWFLNSESPYGCGGVYSEPKLDFKLKFGQADGYDYGKDPRFDSRIKEYLKTRN
ncbi:hypothetical protein JM81_0813 [Maribacter sp. MAR_2009_72]|nr:hypothetical protein JM81_0813 [Maribacter sp. MAR_2009_72]